MKFILSSLMMMVTVTSAFSPTKLLSATTKVSTTQVFNQLDPKMMNHLQRYGEDAESAMFINCDNEGCELVEGSHDRDGWRFESKGQAEPADGQSHMLSMSMQDTE